MRTARLLKYNHIGTERTTPSHIVPVAQPAGMLEGSSVFYPESYTNEPRVPEIIVDYRLIEHQLLPSSLLSRFAKFNTPSSIPGNTCYIELLAIY
jgi:hypothetical protein